MATENGILDISLEAAEDLSGDQFKFVVRDATTGKARRPDSATEIAEGILQNTPAAGEAAAIRVIGISKFEANAALAIGTLIKPEYVAADDAGKGAAAAGELQCAKGIVLEPTDAEDDLGSCFLFGPNPQRVVVSVPLSALTANTTVYDAVYAVNRAMRVTKISVAALTVPVDNDGTALLKVINYDLSSTTDDDLTADFDLEGLTAKNSADLTLTSTAADLILAAGDMIYASLTSNSAGIDTNMADAVLTIEADIL